MLLRTSKHVFSGRAGSGYPKAVLQYVPRKSWKKIDSVRSTFLVEDNAKSRSHTETKQLPGDYAIITYVSAPKPESSGWFVDIYTLIFCERVL